MATRNSKTRTRKTSKVQALTTGFTLGTWDDTFEAIAKARNDNRPKAKAISNVLVEHFTFDIHSLRGGKVSAKTLACLELPRTRAAVERAAAEWAKANPGKPFQVIYRGWFDGTDCLPRYNNPVQKGDRQERIVTFTLPVYTHTGTQGEVAPSNAEAAANAVMAALQAQA